MSDQLFTTAGNISVRRSDHALEVSSALDEIYRAIDERKGVLFSSGFDYPGRHSRWDIGFVDPALEFVAARGDFVFRALNEQGAAILELIAPCLEKNDQIKSLSNSEQEVSGVLKDPPKHFPEEERSRQASIFSVLRSVIELFHSTDEAASAFGLYGAFGYDLVTEFEDIELRLPRAEDRKDCHLLLPLEIYIVDRKRELAHKCCYSLSTPRGETSTLSGGGKSYPVAEASGSSEVECDHEAGEFAEKVREVIAGTERGDYFEVVLSQSFSTAFGGSPMELFSRLSEINPSPYMFLINLGEEQLVGASPEIFVRVTDRRYETCPIAGTVPRGKTALEDADQVKEILSSPKEESELTMCTDVDRNDMARVCVPGTVRIIGRRQLEFYSHLIHTVDHLEGYLRDGFDALDAFQTHMWACTVTGAPKPAAIQTIENLENSPRGWYTGAVGWLAFNGNLNTGITIRTAHLKNGRATTRAGATLLYGSDPDKEELETRTKSAAFLAALAGQQPKKGSQQEETVLPKLKKKSRVLLVDCRDSFVHNLAAYLRELGADVITYRSGFPVEELDKLSPDLVLLSPGPGTPEEFGIPSLVGELVNRELPIFGVCLGHQGIGEHFGAKLAQLPEPEHGKPVQVKHNGSALFQGIDNPFRAGRYHSLYLEKSSLPDCLESIAEIADEDLSGGAVNLPMAIRHKTLPIASVQFHPESLMTLSGKVGHLLLKNALEILS